jgi:sulfatase maturation enzyme AslB (radical SAM superfamily)
MNMKLRAYVINPRSNDLERMHSQSERRRNIAELARDLIPVYWHHRSVFTKAFLNYSRKQPFSASFDITSKCNARCPYCYYYGSSGEHSDSLKDEEMLKFIRSSRQKIPIVHATFIGGEPTLRPNVLREAVTYFPHKWYQRISFCNSFMLDLEC